ncbi:MAG: TlyA family RNA methyltransferase [Anaerolineales bacterium]|nr:TlyA family RNA methyltransferase [Anaerolineales bacterium]MCB9003498.1 TlyA family RNA methyltransferase [Ardenticatenaceae bacterium]
MAKGKERLDKLVVQRGLSPSRAKAQAYIMAGEVLVDGERVDKPGTAVPVTAVITLKSTMPYVGRGGYKLAGALEQFGIDVNGRVCADVGACTGGFTDVLLQNGAAKVYAIDVGYGQLDWKLRQDERVVVMERTNARYLESLPEPVGFVCIDVSFISLKLILPAVRQWLAAQADVVALVKPQFEAGPESVGKGGIVRETAVHQQVLTDILKWCRQNEFPPAGLMRSQIDGSDGNIEFLVWLNPESKFVLDIPRQVQAILSV